MEDKKVGIENQYYNTGGLERQVVSNTAGKILTDNKYWPGGAIREEVFYNPPGVETGAKNQFTEAGVLTAQTVVETTRPDNPNILLRFTSFWSPGVKRVEYYLDKKRLKTDLYREFFETVPPETAKVLTEGLYKAGSRTGVWRTFDIDGAVIKTEVYRT